LTNSSAFSAPWTSPSQLATISSMAASFRLEVIENPPIVPWKTFSARPAFLWIVWKAQAMTVSMARARHVEKVAIGLI
jgi:hypothetical protein